VAVFATYLSKDATMPHIIPLASLAADHVMDESIENLLLGLLEWISQQNRTYDETMSAWRTSCPRLPIWEEANDRKLIEIVDADTGAIVRLTQAGMALLKQPKPAPTSPPPL
jgi:D-3-phosphoglycerate dehydrogenase